MPDFKDKEKEILDFWDKNDIFQKSINRDAPKGDYLFYDGPPFATGLPHYGHLVASIMKDVVPRYWTMKGYRVERKWGWDVHGLPIENIVEKDLGFETKKDIESFGIDKFNENCRSRVMEYADAWKSTIRRIGRWVDMENDYKTMDLEYMESIWWVFKTLWDNGLIYEDYRSMHICPRCETTLSQSEVTEGYKDIKDLSLTAKFELVDPIDSDSNEDTKKLKTYILAWTTTPWTLIGNVALAVGKDIDYLRVDIPEGFDAKKYGLGDFNVAPGKYIFSKEVANKDVDKLHKLFWLTSQDDISFTEFKGKDLIGKSYKPLFPYYAEDKSIENMENGWKVYHGDFVTTEEGTGIVHIAPAFGEDDMNLGKENNLPFLQHVGMDGFIKPEAKDFAGLNVKPKGDHTATDVEVLKYLDKAGLRFSKKPYNHSYPHCWRCDTPLLNYATSSWFVNVLKIKDRLLEDAKNINWIPSHIKAGRFGKWLEGARDWSISRQRFWGSVIPLWQCDKCDHQQVFGSIEELKKASGQEAKDLHKHVVDEITYECKCGGTMRRIPDVLDCWFESGSMPYAQAHYPFDKPEKFKNQFPAKFIAEGADQTRAWFYYLHVIAGGVKINGEEAPNHAFNNCIVNGIVLAEDGKKMSKKLKNYPEPDLVMEKYGADPLRLYLLSSPVMVAENFSFTEKDLQTIYRRFTVILQNVLNFYLMFRGDKPLNGEMPKKLDNDLDKWIVSKFLNLHKEVTAEIEAYNLVKATRPIFEFVDALSTWYVRRSRDRFKGDDANDKEQAIETLGFVLKELAKLIAPFAPMTAEILYNEFNKQEDSVHLEAWSEFDYKLVDLLTLRQMDIIMRIVERVHALRSEKELKVRQPLGTLEILIGKNTELRESYLKILEAELNIENVVTVDELTREDNWVADENIFPDIAVSFSLDTNLTDELKDKGAVREVIRFMNNLRKDAGLSPSDNPVETYNTKSDYLKKVIKEYKKDIVGGTSAGDLQEVNENPENIKECKINGEEITLGLKL